MAAPSRFTLVYTVEAYYTGGSTRGDRARSGIPWGILEFESSSRYWLVHFIPEPALNLSRGGSICRTE